MIDFCLMFMAQLLFQLARVYSTRVISKDHVVITLVMTFFVQILWLITTAMGVHAAFEMDIPQITAYMIGGLLGTYMAMRITWHK